MKPFVLDVKQEQLDELEHRLKQTRWPEKETVDDWSQGTPLSYTQEIFDHWLNEYDWRRCEKLR